MADGDNDIAYKKHVREYNRDWMRRHRNEDPIKIGNEIATYLPKEQFNSKLDEILKENSSGIEEWILKDVLYSIMNENKLSMLKQEVNKKLDEIFRGDRSQIEKKIAKGLVRRVIFESKLPTSKQLFRVYSCSLWAKAIEELMQERDYVKVRDKYVRIQK
jgi:hypothetical protein